MNLTRRGRLTSSDERDAFVDQFLWRIRWVFADDARRGAPSRD
jgi:hypothetical protein